jgi:hypothetical protein
MKKSVQKIALVVFTLLFLFETTGVVLFVHTCSSSETTEISAYTSSGSCCCSSETHDYQAGTGFDAPECCKSEQLYLKASFNGFPVFYKLQDIPLVKILPEVRMSDIASVSGPITSFTPWMDDSPPLTGTDFLYFIKQIRIHTFLS